MFSCFVSIVHDHRVLIEDSPRFNDMESKFRKQRKDKKLEEFDLYKTDTEGEAREPKINKDFFSDVISPFKKLDKKESGYDPETKTKYDTKEESRKDKNGIMI